MMMVVFISILFVILVIWWLFDGVKYFLEGSPWKRIKKLSEQNDMIFHQLEESEKSLRKSKYDLIEYKNIVDTCSDLFNYGISRPEESLMVCWDGKRAIERIKTRLSK